MMKQIIKYTILLVSILFASCSGEKPPQLEASDVEANIYPDYKDVTIPAEIAPMNFNMADEENIAAVYVKVTGGKGGEIESTGKYADFDIDDWHKLTAQNKGGDLTFDVYTKDTNGNWMRYKPFTMHVSQHPLTDYGITYRRIAPGYETFSKIGIHQRALGDFTETPILEETAVDGQCLNCHYANRGNPDQFSIHVRGANGGTIMKTDDGVRYLNTKTDETVGNCTYGYWHPDGRYCAYSLNKIYQNFYVGPDRTAEPWDMVSDIVVYDSKTDQLITTPLLEGDDFQTTPAFSADGKTVYFCHAPFANMPADYDKLKYSILTIPFDVSSGSFGEKTDTILSATACGKSANLPRPSYDGRYLMYNLMDYGTTPIMHPDADLWLLDLRSGEHRKMDEINSEYSDGYHNWSSGSRWFLFNSKRGDHMYALVYLSCIDDNGKATKPFLLPQRNPAKYYRENLHSYNAPDFTTRKVDLDMAATRRMVDKGTQKQVTVKK